MLSDAAARQRTARRRAVMKILVGIDESSHSEAALEFVKKMKWPEGTQFNMLSAIQPLINSYAMVELPVPATVEDATREIHQARQETAARLERGLRERGFKSEAHIVIGDPRTELVEAAKNEHADLLVVGSHGRTGLTKLLLGSVASHVVTHAPCSVLVVKSTPEKSR
jgi:nucleotide-binding universal stress UspA family protein